MDRIPTPTELKEEFPLTTELTRIKQERDKLIADVLTGKSDKLLLICGPCSSESFEPVLDYVTFLAEQQEKYKDRFILIPRIYTAKPRTNSKGYKGISVNPDIIGKPDLVRGLRQARRLHIEVIKETGLTTADELLYPFNLPYFDDILSYVAIGARSVSDQVHRELPSRLTVPVGMKNPECGDLSVMMNAIDAAQSSQSIVYDGHQLDTAGNPLAHVILRGRKDDSGSIPNYKEADIRTVIKLYNERFSHLLNPAIIVDTSHDNSGKDYREQPRIAKDAIGLRKKMDIIKGLMIESYLVEGKQKVSPDGSYVKGQSITDGCLGKQDTAKLFEEIAALLSP